jgi:hypothetical protein
MVPKGFEELDGSCIDLAYLLYLLVYGTCDYAILATSVKIPIETSQKLQFKGSVGSY